MNREEAADLLKNIEMVKAWANGDTIEYSHTPESPNACWTVVTNPVFTASPQCYRIKPKPIEGWFALYEMEGFKTESNGPYESKQEAQSRCPSATRVAFLRETQEG